MCAYTIFKNWQKGYGVNNITCDLMLAYLNVLHQKNYKPTSLWAFHSMLKSTLRGNENVDIASFLGVTSFLKTISSGYKCVKAKVFEEEQIRKFIDKADDSIWLDVKVSIYLLAI